MGKHLFLCPFKPRNSIEKLLGIFCAPLDLSVVYFPLFLNEDCKYTYTLHFTVCWPGLGQKRMKKQKTCLLETFYAKSWASFVNRLSYTWKCGLFPPSWSLLKHRSALRKPLNGLTLFVHFVQTRHLCPKSNRLYTIKIPADVHHYIMWLVKHSRHPCNTVYCNIYFRSIK